jgi:ATP-dependent helicase HepA
MSDWLHKLVLAQSDRRLFGKVIADLGDSVEIEFFRSVADRERRQFAKREVVHLSLPAQTRIFAEVPGKGWRVGRVRESEKSAPGTYSYLVRFPNDVVAELSEVECFVRCLDRYADPARILSAHCIETQFFADRRRRALTALRRLRTAAQGLTGIVSAPVELVPHQLATVRRVVTDRHQRYLLADEVGLGKTIEAGLIIRQLLLDRPQLQVQVWVPAVLEKQWRQELDVRCLLKGKCVGLRAHEDLNDIDWANVPDLLVIDEAHRLIVTDGITQRATFNKKVRETALNAPRLLLLSATPALGEEAQLLALLTLLDPAAYERVPLEEFRRRVADRQLIGRLLLPMRPGAKRFVLQQQASRALEMFPSDAVVRTEASRVLHTSETKERDAATVALRDHIANTYRIHQRIIRARRIDVEGSTLKPRGPAWPAMPHVRFFYGTDGYANDVLRALDGWRHEAARMCDDDETRAPILAERWGQLLEASWGGATLLAKVVDELKPLFAGEDQDLAELLRVGDTWASSDDRYTMAVTTVSDWLRHLATESQQLEKLVCFSTDRADAQRLADHLKRAIGAGKVLSLVTMRDTEASAAVSAFAASKTNQVLVCDRSAEEGLNLQFARGIVHMDLPLDAARIEQRIGRLDRFGRLADRVEHRIFMLDDADDTPWQAWFGVLANGFRVFNQSISDVQFQVNPLQRRTILRLLRTGSHEVEAMESQLAASLSAERERLDEQHALDGLSGLVDAGEELRRAIDGSEKDEAGTSGDVEPWFRDVLGLSVEPVGPRSSTVRRFAWSRDTLLPAIPWKGDFEPVMRQRWTWSRTQSLRNGHPPPQLIRPGSGLTEVLERVALWDDRGIAYATWRVEPQWDGQSRAFRLVWMIEPALEVDTPIYTPRRGSEISRRAEALLPPFAVEQYLDEHGVPIDNPALREVLARPYNQQRSAQGQFDLNLGSRPDALREAIDWTLFVSRSEEVTRRGRKELLRLPEVATQLADARQACELDLTRARRLFDIRRELAKQFPNRVEAPVADEESDLGALQRAIDSPSIRLDEIGFFVVSPTPPES